MITLLTDFGNSDFYVGSMKGVLLSINPHIQIVDITHNVSSQNIEQGAFLLKQVYHYFPQGTIHVVVVDPGVGSNRNIIAVETEKYLFLAPDNGVLKYIYNDCSDYRVIAITARAYFLAEVSTTFHGRDIFAPIAGHLSLGVDIRDLGEECSDYLKPEIIKPVREKNKIMGEIIYIDSFGNCITNIEKEIIQEKEKLQITIKNKILPGIESTYSAVKRGESLALLGSSGMLEISINQGNAHKRLGIEVGDKIVIEGSDEDKDKKKKEKRKK